MRGYYVAIATAAENQKIYIIVMLLSIKEMKKVKEKWLEIVEESYINFNM